MIKKSVVFFVLLLSFRVIAFAAPSVSAERAVLMVADTRQVIYAKNEHEQCGIASTTKIMTALLTLECCTPEKEITVTERMTAVEGTSMGLLPGDKVTYNALVYGMLLASGNDAANTAALSIAGSIENFAQLMNKRAKQIGMTNTNFVTPSGLDAENHYSTAYDMALLGCEAIENPDFCRVCSQTSAKLCYGNEPYTRWLNNHNKLLKNCDGVFGIKTGFTKKSGRCLVSAAERDGVKLVCVTLNAPDDWQDHKRLLEYGFSVVNKNQVLIDTYKVNVFGGSEDTVSVGSNPIEYCLSDNNAIPETKVALKPYAVAPVKKGEILGEIQLIKNGRIIKSVPLTANEDINATTVQSEEKPGLIIRIKQYMKNLIFRIISSIKER